MPTCPCVCMEIACASTRLDTDGSKRYLSSHCWWNRQTCSRWPLQLPRTTPRKSASRLGGTTVFVRSATACCSFLASSSSSCIIQCVSAACWQRHTNVAHDAMGVCGEKLVHPNSEEMACAECTMICITLSMAGASGMHASPCCHICAGTASIISCMLHHHGFAVSHLSLGRSGLRHRAAVLVRRGSHQPHDALYFRDCAL